MDTLNLNSTFITDCVNCALKGSKNEIIVCLITVTIGALIRHFEKKRIVNRKNSRNDFN